MLEGSFGKKRKPISPIIEVEAERIVIEPDAKSGFGNYTTVTVGESHIQSASLFEFLPTTKGELNG